MADFYGIINERCIENLRKEGKEVITLSNGDRFILSYTKDDRGRPTGALGRGCYVLDIFDVNPAV
jgi:hypothetical protein